jgi:hypothetical protein
VKVEGITARDHSQTQSNPRMDFLNSAQEFFDPITKPIRNTHADFSNSMTNSMMGGVRAVQDMLATTDQIITDTREFGEDFVGDIRNAATLVGEGMSRGVERQISTVEAIGDNPGMLPTMVVQSLPF